MDFISYIILLFDEKVGDKVCLGHMLPTIVYDVQDIGLWSLWIVGVLITSPFEYIVRALYINLMS